MAGWSRHAPGAMTPRPGPGQLVLRGILGDAGLELADLRPAATLNAELDGFYGVSVWVADRAWPRERLEATKLMKFERYASSRSLA
jgi:hypothetical protein